MGKYFRLCILYYLCHNHYTLPIIAGKRVYVLSWLSCVWLFVILWTVVCQAPLSMGFSRQEYWSRWPYPPSGDLSNPGIKPGSLKSPALRGRFLTTSASWEAPSGSSDRQYRNEWTWLFQVNNCNKLFTKMDGVPDLDHRSLYANLWTTVSRCCALV